MRNFPYSVAELQARELKRTGEVTHILAGRREQIDLTLGKLFSLGPREVTAIAHYDLVFHPAREHPSLLSCPLLFELAPRRLSRILRATQEELYVMNGGCPKE